MNPRRPTNPTPNNDGRFDLLSYLGRWYEIGRLPTFFQQQCARSIAEYNQAEPNNYKQTTIMVQNYCLNSEGQVIQTITGNATVAWDGIPPQLIVTFPNTPPPTGVNYVVEETDYQSYAIVGNPEKTNLFWLARQETISQELYQYLLARSQFLGYDVTEVILDAGAVEGIDNNNDQDNQGSEVNYNYLWIVLAFFIILIIAYLANWWCGCNNNTRLNSCNYNKRLNSCNKK